MLVHGTQSRCIEGVPPSCDALSRPGVYSDSRPLADTNSLRGPLTNGLPGT